MEQMELFKAEDFEDVGAKASTEGVTFTFVREGEVVLKLTPDEASVVYMAIGQFLNGLRAE
jgi:hypothetical protein